MQIKWLAKEKEILEKMINANKTPEEVAMVLKGRTAGAIVRMAQKMKLSFYNPKIDFEEFKKLMKEEVTETCL